MKEPLLLALTLMLLLTACAPATIGGFFAACPVPTAEEWETAQAEWLASHGGLNLHPSAETDGSL